MTTTFLLIRHAAHDDVGLYLAGRMEGVKLGAAGLAQANRLAERLSGERIDAVFSSPRERTRQTAGAIAVACEVGPVSVCEDLDEVDFGEWSGRTFDELNRDLAWRHWNDDRQKARTPTGESMAGVQLRMLRRMERCCSAHAGDSVVLVSHADVIKTAVCHVLGLTLDNCFRFDIDPASVTTLVMGDWGAKLLKLNDVR
jgi:broad specificity phosphatase PhoE